MHLLKEFRNEDRSPNLYGRIRNVIQVIRPGYDNSQKSSSVLLVYKGPEPRARDL